MSPIVTAPRLEYGDSAAGNVPVSTPRISWKTKTEETNWVQQAAEISLQLGEEPQVVRIEGQESVLVDWPFPALQARDTGSVKVRVLAGGEWSDWSDATSFTASFLGADEWRATFMGLEAPEQHAQPFLARTEFEVRPDLRRATWYATAHGTYQTWANGQRVDDQILKPGWTPYQFRLIHETTDITHLLSTGRNALGVAITGGWYTEHYGFQGQAAPVYGTQASFAGQLLLEYEDGTSEWLSTPDRWRVTPDGPWVRAGIYLGEDYDFRRILAGWSETGFRDSSWQEPRLVAQTVAPSARTSPEVRVTETLPVAEVVRNEDGRVLLDFGQNLVGRLRIRVRGASGHTLTLRHAEVLDAGELGTRPLRMARAADVVTLSGAGVDEYAPEFTFHGFRYAEIDGWPGEFNPADVVAEVIFSDMRRTGWFESSNKLVNRLHENVVWGMKGNFVYLPTDCPQRDERMGWTGDIQMFGPTASFLYDCNGFLDSWLEDLALEQEAVGGGVAFTIPDVLNSGRVPTAAWGDAATVVPSVLYERFNNRDLLQRQYASMKGWTDLLLDLAGDRHLWEGGYQWGDWVDPDSPPEDPARAKTDPDIVASAFLYHSTNLTAKAAAILGHEADAEAYARRAALVREAWLREYVTASARIVSDAQTAYALAIQFGIADEELAIEFGRRLAFLVRRDGYKITTGFVGTPLVNDALTSTGQHNAAARLLLQTECPSWLYSVSMGATTIWERWDSLLPDGSINPGEMTSFNHYALGSVADWLHRVVAGLAPASPGYQQVRISPTPLTGLDWARARHEGPYGLIEVGWKRTNGVVQVEATIPPNSTAVVELPGRDSFEVGSGTHSWEFPAPAGPARLESITRDTMLADIIDDEDAHQAVLAAFEEVSPIVGQEFRTRTKWLPSQPLSAAFAIVAPKVADQIMHTLSDFEQRANNTK